MKKLLLILIISIPVLFLSAQTADDYFPADPGYTWKYNAVPLDSLNNPIDSLAFVELDSFAVVSNYEGREANVVLSKAGPGSIINLLPYTDSSYYDMDGSTGWEYFKVTGLDSLLSGLDSTLAATFLELLESFEDWYSVYRFAQTPNAVYQVFNFDTVITFQGTPLSMRFRLEGKRFTDETITTAIGDFTCKKFLVSSKVIYLFLGIIPITVVDMADTNWIAPDNWIVKRFTPSTLVDLSFAGIPAFSIPGFKYDIAEPSVTGIRDEEYSPAGFTLYQNYPNPFNPSTIIKYRITEQGHTRLMVFDILGNEVAALVNTELNPGVYEVVFNAGNLAGGIYYCRLISGRNQEVRKMLLLK